MISLNAQGNLLNNAPITDSSGAIATTAWVKSVISDVIYKNDNIAIGQTSSISTYAGESGNRNIFLLTGTGSNGGWLRNKSKNSLVIGNLSAGTMHTIGGTHNTIINANGGAECQGENNAIIAGYSGEINSGCKNSVILGGYALEIPDDAHNGCICTGYYNDTSNMENAMFVIGNGTTTSSKSNAFKVTYDGSVYAANSAITQGADYAEYFEWLNKNKDNNEKYANHFVTLDEDKIRVANAADDYIVGVISSNPGVIGNFDMNDTTFEEDDWGIVGLMGQIIVADDGTCAPNSYCAVADGGIATRIGANSIVKYRVLKRIDQNHIKILFR